MGDLLKQLVRLRLPVTMGTEGIQLLDRRAGPDRRPCAVDPDL